MKTIKDYLPEPIEQGKIIQGRVPAELFDKAKKIMRRDNLGWNEVLTALIALFIDSDRERNKRGKS